MRRAALLTSVAAAIPAAIAGFTVAASAALFGLDAWARDSFRLWWHPYFADGLRWMWAWWPFASDPATRAALGNKLWLAGAAGLLPVGFVAQGLWKTATETAKAPLHGKARFATKAEVKQAGISISARPPADAILLGQWGWGPWRRYLSDTSESHIALYARTGAGKGVSFVIPTCLTWGGSLVAYDIKGELWKITAGARKADGQAVFRFAPTDESGFTHRYNPYSVVPRGDAKCIEAIHQINHVLIPPNPQAKEPWFDNMARSVINGLSVMIAETPGMPLHPGAVRRLALRSDGVEVVRKMIVDARAAGRPYPQSAIDDVNVWAENEDPRTRETIRSTIQSHLSLWSSPTIAAATETSDFDLRQLRQRPMSIYVCLGPADTRRLRPLVTLLFQQIVTLNTKVGEEFKDLPEPRCRVLMMLDEFAAMGPMPILADSVAYVRSFGIRMAYVVQTKPQLVSIYGKEGADNLFENTGPEIWFGVKSRKVAEDASADLGHDTVTETTRSRPRFMAWATPAKQNESETARRRALMLPQEVRRLPPWREVITLPHSFPVSARRIVWHRDPAFRHLAADPPEVPRLNVVVERDSGTTTKPAHAWKALL